jgi:hypothetical protein
MGSYSRIAVKNTVLFATIVLICISLLGCSAVGRVVPTENRMELANSTAQEVFEADGLRVIYSYNLQDDIMSFSCRVSVRFRVQSFNAKLLFLDAQGTVLQQNRVFSSGDRFSEKALVVPSGAVAISFNYSSQPFRGRQ